MSPIIALRAIPTPTAKQTNVLSSQFINAGKAEAEKAGKLIVESEVAIAIGHSKRRFELKLVH